MKESASEGSIFAKINNNEYESKLVISTTANKDERLRQRKERNKDQLRLYRQFKQDLVCELGIANHPKADTLYELAWEYGRDSGLSEVLLYAEDLVKLLR